jgi:hypothetical protein
LRTYSYIRFVSRDLLYNEYGKYIINLGETMGEKYLLRSIRHIFFTIKYCHENEYLIPELILIYNFIDIISWIACKEDNKKTRARFQEWVDKWMLTKYPLTCNSEELYSARCGIIHNLSPESDLTRNHDIRKICYAYKKAKVGDLEKSIEILKQTDLVVVHLDDLISSLTDGLSDYLTMLEDNPEEKELFNSKAQKHFSYTENSVVKEFLGAYKKQSINPYD